ncbi:MAG: branched-chain amino acid ABC transporter permease [Chloroflexota bacterium]
MMQDASVGFAEVPWRAVIRVGLIGAAVAIFLCLVGIVPVFHARPLIKDVISLGQTAIVLALLWTGLMAARTSEVRGRLTVLPGALAGSIAGAGLTALVILGELINVRAAFLNASPALYEILTFGNGLAGSWIAIVIGAVLGAAGSVGAKLPIASRRPLTTFVLTLLLAGLFAGILRTAMLSTPLAGLGRLLFAPLGLTIVGAIVTVVLFVGGGELLFYTRVRDRVKAMAPAQQRLVTWPLLAMAAIAVLVLPQALGPFVAQVVALVALYVLMGLGLNITLGLAGLLDLGFVAFFAVGAYTVGLLTSTAEFGLADWPFWAAIPFAVLFAMVFGAILGLPILGIRGDYLAIATLGFGEIIRILAGSDVLKPWLGGPRGILNIPKPIDVEPTHFLAGPAQIYYIAIACAVLIAFVAWRLRGSRIGRAWLSIREDEDVAEALGVNLVQTKILAYVLGAGFAGLGGGIFSSLVGSIFSSSIQLFVSINVVAIVVVGGMGSIPGAVLGAIFLIGVPELFREFSEYRFLFYGAALILMMLYRPEGLMPTRFAAREVHLESSELGADTVVAAPTESS